MKAVVFTEYGPPEVLQLEEVAKPVPNDDEILIRVRATPVHFGDITVRNIKTFTLRTFSMPTPLWLPVRLEFGFDRPKKSKRILGGELAGEVEAVGSGVTRFKPGDHVFAYRGSLMGANAEYLCMPASGLVAHKPTTMSHAEAAAVPYGALTALTLLRRVKVQPGQRVLVIGASGGIGSAAVQLAKHDGATVTGVCSTPGLELVEALGADEVIDYTREDFTRNGERYDLIFDILGKSSFSACRGSLTPNGRYLLASFKTRSLLRMLWTALFSKKKVVCAMSNAKPEDLVVVKDLVEAGAMTTVIDRCYPLARAADAHRYVESRRKAGHVVLTVGS